MEEPINFLNRNGQRLFGIVHTPQGPSNSPRTGVIMLLSGFGTRTYVHNFYVKIARELCQKGYYVLRFDFHGLGESEGDFPPALYIEYHNDVENGLFVSDVESSIDFLTSDYKVDNIILVGICGGAITGLFVIAEGHPQVKGGILIGLPVTLDSPDRLYQEEITPGSAKLTISEYFPKLLSLYSLLRFFSFKSDYRVIFRSMITLIKSRLSKSSLLVGRNWEQYVTHPAFNRKIIHAFLSCMEKRLKLYIIFAEFDRVRWEFESEFQEKFLKQDTDYNDCYQIEIIPQANHEFHFPESKKILSNLIINWLDKYFPIANSKG